MNEEIEKRVLKMLLDGNDPTLETLRKQLSTASVERREITGSGFFTHFRVSGSAPVLSGKRNFAIGDVCGELGGEPCGFILFVRDGAIDLLECHTWGDSHLPENAGIDRLYYVKHDPGSSALAETPERNLSALRATWATSGSDIPIAVAVILSQGKVLLSRRPEGSHLEGLWEFPGGKVKPGESPVEAVRREVKEETGLRLGDVVLLHRQEFQYPERRVDISFYLARDFKGDILSREGLEVLWAEAASLGRYRMPAANARAVQLIVEQFS